MIELKFLIYFEAETQTKVLTKTERIQIQILYFS